MKSHKQSGTREGKHKFPCQPSPEIHTFGADISKLLGASIYVVNISSLRWCTISNSNVKVPGLGGLKGSIP